MYSICRRKLYPESCQSQDTPESLQNSANTLILPNSGLNASELTTVVGLIPLRNGWRLHIVSLMRKCLDGSVTPYFNNYFHLNSSIHTVFRHSYAMVRRRSLFYFTEAKEYSSLTCHLKAKNSYTEFSKDIKDF